jgi:uncharacterized phage-associated protein
MRNLITCHVVADYFLLKVDPTAGDTISNLKLQKLCYYAQAWSLALHKKPLFGERIEAWTHGPAIPDLFERMKGSGWQAVDPTQLVSDPLAQLPDETKSLLDEVWRKYGWLTGRQLEQLTRGEAPWKDAHGKTPLGMRCDAEISQEALRKFYRSQATRNADDTRSATA